MLELQKAKASDTSSAACKVVVEGENVKAEKWKHHRFSGFRSVSFTKPRAQPH